MRCQVSGHSIKLIWLLAAKLIIVCNNCPPIRKSEIEYYAMLSKTTVHHYTGSKFTYQSCLGCSGTCTWSCFLGINLSFDDVSPYHVVFNSWQRQELKLALTFTCDDD
jgi:hypothetical protein